MKFIKRAIYNLIKWAAKTEESAIMRDEPTPYSVAKNQTISMNRHGPDTVGMNFTVFNAVGGKVIQINQYNPLNDRSKQSLYIITDKEDLGAELGQIITIESLNR